LAESKVTIVADTLRRAQDFIQVTEICAKDEFPPPADLEEARRR